MTERVELLVEGGKATPAPPLGPKLGELKMNVSEVISRINAKTQAFKGMRVPVILEIHEDKSYDLSVGTPPVSELIKKEAGLEKGSGVPNKQKVGNLAIEQVIKVAQMKKDSMFGSGLKSYVKSVIGSCNAMGVLVEGKSALEINPDVDAGRFDAELTAGKIEAPPEKLKLLSAQLAEIQAKLKAEEERLKAAEAAAKAEAGVPEEAAEEGKEEKGAEKKEEKPKKEEKGAEKKDEKPKKDEKRKKDEKPKKEEKKEKK